MAMLESRVVPMMYGCKEWAIQKIIWNWVNVLKRKVRGQHEV